MDWVRYISSAILSTGYYNEHIILLILNTMINNYIQKTILSGQFIQVYYYYYYYVIIHISIM